MALKRAKQETGLGLFLCVSTWVCFVWSRVGWRRVSPLRGQLSPGFRHRRKGLCAEYTRSDKRAQQKGAGWKEAEREP